MMMCMTSVECNLIIDGDYIGSITPEPMVSGKSASLALRLYHFCIRSLSLDFDISIFLYLNFIQMIFKFFRLTNSSPMSKKKLFG